MIAEGCMDVTITARHCDIPAATRAHAADRVRRLQRFEPRVEAAQVRVEPEPVGLQVETVVSVPGGRSLIARVTADSFRAALDGTVDRLERQLRRRRERVRQRRTERPAPVAMPLLAE
jgi:ribosomal subunit interface protein